MRIQWLLLFSLLLFSCEIDYSVGLVSEKDNQMPDMVMTGVTQLDIQGEQIIQVKADKLEIFDDIGETRFYNAEFQEVDKDDKLLRQGKAQSIIQYDNDNLSMKGNIEVKDLEEESSVTADELYWNDSDRLLTSPVEGKVIIELGADGSISGTGLNADLKKKELTIQGSVSGTIKDSE